MSFFDIKFLDIYIYMSLQIQSVKIVQLAQLDYYGYIKFFGAFVGTWVGAFTNYLITILIILKFNFII